MTDRSDPPAIPISGATATVRRGPCTAPSAIGAVLLALEGVGTLPGLARLLDHLAANGVPCIVASSLPRSVLDRRLQEAGCAQRLTMRVVREDTPPFPDASSLFLAAARLAMPNDRTVIIAEGDAALAAAQKTGSVTISLDTGRTVAAGGMTIARLDEPIPFMEWIEERSCFRHDRPATRPVAMTAGAS